MVVGIIMALWVIIYIAFRTPPVQRWVTGKISEQLSKKLNTRVNLDGIDIDWFDGVSLDGVYLEDQQQDTLLYVKKFEVTIEPWALFNKTLYIRLIEVRGLYANLYQPEGRQELNFAFIPEAFASEKPQPEADTTSSAWDIDLYQIQLNDIRFDYKAEGTEMNMALNKLAMLFDKLGLQESHIQGDELNIDGLRFAMLLPSASPTDTVAVDTAAVSADSTVQDVLNPSGFAYSLNELTIENSQIIYRVKQPDTIHTQQINFENMVLDQLYTRVEDIQVGANDVKMYLQNLAFTEANSGFTLNEVEARADVDMPRVRGSLLNFKTAHTQLNGDINVSMTLTDDMQALMNSLQFDSRLNQMVIGMADAAYFTDALDSLPAVRDLSPRLSWQVHVADGEGKVENLLLKVDDQAKVAADLAFNNLAALDSSATGSPYFDMHLSELSAKLAFIRQFTSDSLDQYFQNQGSDELSMTAEAQGHLDDLKAKAELRSGLGYVVTNATYAVRNNTAAMSARLSGNQLNIRQVMRLLGNPDSVANVYDKLNFHATADAQAIYSSHDTTLSRADVKLTVDKFDYKDHTYRNLTLQSLLVRDSVQAEIAYQDSLLEMHANAQASLKENDQSYLLNMQVKNANLFRLHLASDSIIVVNSLLQAKARGSNADDIVGYLRIKDTEIIKDADTYKMDSLLLQADRKGSTRIFTLNSDNMNAEMSGNFDIESLPAAIEDFQQYYFAAYEAPATPLDTVKTDDGKYQQLKFTFSVDNTPALARAFMPELEIRAPINAEANFNSRDKSMNLDITAPNVAYGGNAIESLYVNAHTTEKTIALKLQADSTKVGGLTIPALALTGSLSGTPDENAQPSKKKLTTTRLDFNLKMGENDASYRLDFDARLSSREDTITVKLNESELVLQDQAWKFSKDARLVYATNYLDINDFSLSQNGQEIFITTDNSNAGSDLKLAIKQLAIGPFLDAFDLEDYGIKGTLQGNAMVKDMFKPGPVSATLAMNNLVVKDQTIGEFQLKAEKDSPESDSRDLLSVLMTLQGPDNDLRIDGNYNLAAEKDNINLQFDLNKLQLEPWQVFVEDYIKDLKGTLQANLKITGSPLDPSIDGNLGIAKRVLLQTTIAGATYYLKEQKIDFAGKEVRFNNFTILDSAQTPAVLNGTVDYTKLTDPAADLSFKTQKFLLVNSKEYENENFYGRAIGTADITMKGPVSSLVISGDVGVNEGTDMVVALVSGAEEAAQAGFINFVDKNAFLAADSLAEDSVVRASSIPRTDTISISGFSVNTNVRINPKAHFTIVIDPVNGDKVEASGEGDLEVHMSPNGDMNMQGALTLNSGAYNLSFAGLVKKEFTVREGSTITWTGDPANANMNLTAVYTAETNLEDLVDPETLVNDQMRQAVATKQKVNVLLSITGTLEAPALAFDIEVPTLALGGASVQLIQDIIQQIKQDQTELYKQVFGLIVLNRFIPPSGGFGAGSGGGGYAGINEKIDSSVSRLLSSQLSKLTEDYLGGVELNVGLQSADQTQSQQTALASRDLDVQLSKKLFNDRLTVSVGGTTTLGNEPGSASASGEGSTAGILGEFEVLYRIDKTGNLNIKIFQKSDRNALTNQIEQRSGVSVLYQKSFNEVFEKDEELKSKSTPEEKKDNNTKESQDTVSDSTKRREKGQ